MKWNDPIVEEVRATRERLLQEAGGFECSRLCSCVTDAARKQMGVS